MIMFKLFGLLLATLLLILSNIGCTADTSEDVTLVPPPAPSAEALLSAAQAQVEKTILACGAKLSEAKRRILSAQVAAVAQQVFEQETDRRWFYTLICIESKFNNEARSSVGATGLTQVMPQFAKEVAKDCGLGELDAKDLADSQVNLLVGACRFKQLMLFYEGDVTLALAAYNSGQGSKTVKKIVESDVRTGHPETVGYLAAAFVLKHRIQRIERHDRQASANTP